jgi:hypothetical protein
MRRTRVTLLLGLLCGGALGCSSASGDSGAGDGGASCPNAPNGCSKPAPSYRAVIAPILEQNCIPCHGPKGNAGYSESTYAEVFAQASPILDSVAGCAMPPSSYPPLTTEQHDALLDWLVCGAPDN